MLLMVGFELGDDSNDIEKSVALGQLDQALNT
jgi:hypothetical protein